MNVDSYNVELKDDEGFLGDRASKGAFRAIIENWRKPLRKAGKDPFGDEPSEDISKKTLDGLLTEGDPEATGIVQGAIEDFAQELALVIRRFLKLKAWRDTERIVVGGGFRKPRRRARHRAGGGDFEGRQGLYRPRADPPRPGRGRPHRRRASGAALDVRGARRDPGVDIGGTNIRAGVVAFNLKKAPDVSKADVWKFELWRHGEEKRLKRQDAVEQLVGMLKGLITRAGKEGLRLAVGVYAGRILNGEKPADLPVGARITTVCSECLGILLVP